MSLFEKGSVYEQPSVYNQGGGGGGGGDGTFMVNGQTLFFPPFLQPVEYVDTTDFNENTNFCILGSVQMNFNADASQYKLKSVFQYAKSKMIQYAKHFVFAYMPNNQIDNNREVWAKMEKANNGTGSFIGSYGTNSCFFYDINLDKKLTFEINGSSRYFSLKEEGGASYNWTDSRAYPNVNMGVVNVLNAHLTSNGVFHGKYYYTHVTKGQDVVSLLVPARSKNPDDKKPYIVECATGCAMINYGTHLSTTGIAFGPDIDFSDIQNYFT